MSSNGSNPVPLADLVEDTIGGLWGDSPDSAKPDNIAVLVIRGADFRRWSSHRAANAARRVIPRRLLARRELRLGDLVLEVSGGGPSQPVGRVVVIDGETLGSAPHPLIPSNFCRRIRLKPSANPFFVKRQLDSLYRDGYFDQYQTSSTNIRNLQVDAFLNGTVLYLPAPDEQERLAKFADDFDLHTTSVHSHLSLALNYMQRFRQSVLAAACSGELTADWRAGHPEVDGGPLASDLAFRKANSSPHRTRAVTAIAELDLPDIPPSWSWMSVDSISHAVVDGVHKTPNYVDSGVPFVTVRNLTAGPGVNFERLHYISEADHRAFTARTRPERGDILVSKDGTLGVVRKVDTDREFSIFVSVAMVKPLMYEMSDYLVIALSSPQVQRQMVGVGSGLVHLVLRDLKADGIPVPPLEEQHQIVARVKALMQLADAVSERIEKLSSNVERTAMAVLSTATRGAPTTNHEGDQ